MLRDAPSSHRFSEGFLGLYALALMERKGTVYGYEIADQISERTEGKWRPGAGAVYPALQRLADGGFARARVKGRRREYAITPKGREKLANFRVHQSMRGNAWLDISVLMSDVVGNPDLSQFLLSRLRRSVDAVETYLERSGAESVSGALLREDALRELVAFEQRLRRSLPRGTRIVAGRAGGAVA